VRNWLRVHVDRADVRADHVDVVEMRVGPVLQQPGTAGLHPQLGHRHRLARAVDHLGPVERERADRLRVLPVGTADRADIADVVRAQHRVAHYRNPSRAEIIGIRSLPVHSAGTDELKGVWHDS
jgi:hypothetical protein